MLFPLLAVALIPGMVSGSYSEGEFNLLINLCNWFHTRFLVVVAEEPGDALSVNYLKTSSYQFINSMVISGGQLEEFLLRMDAGSVQRKTILATKDAIGVNDYLTKVRHPGRYTWVLFMSEIRVPKNETAGEVFLVRNLSDRLEVAEIYYPRFRADQMEISTAFVTEETGFSWVRPGAHSRSKIILNGTTLRVGFPPSDAKCSNLKDKTLFDMIFCCHASLMEIVTDAMNIHMKPVLTFPSRHQYVLPNGTYTGYFKTVLDEEVDISTGAFVITEKRLNDFDFIWPTFTLEAIMYVPKKRINENWLYYIPFNQRVWVSLLLWIPVAGTLLHVCEKYSARASTKLSTSILEIIELMCCQGASDVQRTISCRILCITADITALLLFYYYSATVVSYLTVEQMVLPFKDIDGFVANGNYKLTTVYDSFPIYYFMHEKSRVSKMARDFLVTEDDLPKNELEGVQQICNGGDLIYVDLRGNLRHLGECAIIEIPTPLLVEYFGLALQKNSPCTQFLKQIYHRFYELGFFNKMEARLSKAHDLTLDTGDDQLKTLTFHKVAVMFLVVFAGSILSVLLITLEIYLYPRYSRNRPAPVKTSSKK